MTLWQLVQIVTWGGMRWNSLTLSRKDLLGCDKFVASGIKPTEFEIGDHVLLKSPRTDKLSLEMKGPLRAPLCRMVNFLAGTLSPDQLKVIAHRGQCVPFQCEVGRRASVGR